MIALAIIGLVLGLVTDNRQKADDHLQLFYSEMLSANFTDAYKNIDEAVRLWPTNSRYYGWRAYCKAQRLPSQCGGAGGPGLREEKDSLARAIVADYRQALNLNTRDSVARHNLAWLEHLLGNNTSASKDWQEAIAIDPDNAIFHVSYGMFLEETGDLGQAAFQYQSSIELSPAIVDSPFFSQYRRRSLGPANSVVSAVMSRIEDKLKRGKDPILEARLGKLCEFTGDLHRSEALLEDSAEQLPNLPLVWLNLGKVYEMQGKPQQAMDCFRKARILKDSLAEVHLGMGEIELTSGPKKEAAQDFIRAVSLWQRMKPITAAHNNRLYAGPPQMIDDLLPTTLVWYTAPCEASRAWQGLAQLFPEKQEYAVRTNTCEQLPSPHVFSMVQ